MKIQSAEFAFGAMEPKGYPTDGLPQIPVVGRSNVGKSSLLNYLVNRKALVRTSQTPGKTREINFFLINKTFYLVDVPGFGYAKTDKGTQQRMSDAIQAYFLTSKWIHGVLYLIDIRRSDADADREAVKWLTEMDHPLLMVATKADKLGSNARRKALEEIKVRFGLPEEPIPSSVLAKTGAPEIWSQVQLLLEGESPVE